jgi:ABC-type Fe3+-citrate transport system substrate-binding protein
VLKIAELLNSDKAIKARLAELKKATKDARAEIVASGRECVAVDKAKADAQAEYHKHQEQMAGELKQHRGVGGWTAELDSVKKQAADLKAKAEAGAAAAAKIRADLQRRLKLITEAA